MKNRIDKFFKPFEKPIQDNIIEFGKRLSEKQADVFIFMARKATCLIACMESLSLTEINGFGTTERILDMDTEFLKDKRIVIVDDTIVSGTTLYRTINELNDIPIKSIEVIVMAVNEEWFSNDLLINKMTGESYVEKPYLVLKNQECIKHCSDIVKAISLIPRPYDVDYPLFSNIKTTYEKLTQLVKFNEWESDETSSLLQRRHNIKAITLTPRRNSKYFFNEYIGFAVSEISVLKVRLYCIQPKKQSNSVIVKIVPFALLHPLKEPEINRLFDAIIINSKRDKKYFYKHFKTPTSRLRFIQYIIAVKLAKFWATSIREVCMIDQKLIVKHLMPNFLFTPVVLREVMELSEKDYQISIFPNIALSKIQQNEISESLSTIEYDSDLISIQSKLTEPFLNLFKLKEIKARNLVKDYGREAFKKDDYKLLDRLYNGFSFLMLLNLIKEYKEKFNTMKIVSLFIDKGIDAGIIVPTFAVTEDKVYYRAFRHGEDVQFGEEEEKLCYILLKAFKESSKKSDLPHFLVEKLLVLLLQVGTQNDFLDLFISNTPETHSVASVKYYLHGPVVTYHGEVEPGEDTGPPYLSEDATSSWIPHILARKEILKTRRYLKNEQKKAVIRYDIGIAPLVELTVNKQSQAENLGIIMGTLISNKEDPKINSSDDLICLTACLQPTQIAPALAAEVSIFAKFWTEFVPILNSKLKNKTNYIALAILMRRQDKVFFTAMDSGFKKFIHFMRKDGHELIKRISNSFSENKKLERNIWRSFWSENSEWKKESINQDLWQCIVNLGLWIICVNIYVRIIELCIRRSAESKKSSEDENKKSCESLINRIGMFKNLLFEYTDEPVRTKMRIIPFVQSFLGDNHSRDNHSGDINYAQYLEHAKNQLGYLVDTHKRICEDAELIVRPFGEPLSINKFQYALFLEFKYPETSDEELKQNTTNLLDNIIRRFTKGISIKNIRDSEDSSLIFLPQNKNYLKKGIWILCNGNRSNTILINLALTILKDISPHVKTNSVLLAQLDNFTCFKSSGLNNTNIIPGQFWKHVKNCSNLFEFSEKELHVLKILSPSDSESKNELDKIKNKDHFYTNFKVVSEEIEYGDGFMKSKYRFDKAEKKIGKTGEDKLGGAQSQVDVGIITVKPSETRAVLRRMKNAIKKTGNKTNRTYHLGSFDGLGNAEHKVALVQQLKQGQRPVISTYNDLQKDFNPKLMVLLGIAGSIDKDVGLCDVVICDQIIYYEPRKENSDGVKRRGEVYNIPPLMLNFVNDFFVEHGEFPNFDSANNSYSSNFKVFFGPIGSGEAVIGDKLSAIKKWLLDFTDKTMAVEMEAGGFAHASYEADLSNDKLEIGNLIIRGISDHADHDKDDKWREPAAENAAIVLSKILKLLPDLDSFIKKS